MFSDRWTQSKRIARKLNNSAKREARDFALKIKRLPQSISRADFWNERDLKCKTTNSSLLTQVKGSLIYTIFSPTTKPDSVRGWLKFCSSIAEHDVRAKTGQQHRNGMRKVLLWKIERVRKSISRTDLGSKRKPLKRETQQFQSKPKTLESTKLDYSERQDFLF